VGEAADLIQESIQAVSLVGFEKSAAGREFTLSIEFPMQTEGNDYELSITRSTPTMALGDVRMESKLPLCASGWPIQTVLFPETVRSLRKLSEPDPSRAATPPDLESS
jgi:hypothetical protein